MGGGSCGGLDDGLEIAFEPVHGREPPSGSRHSNGDDDPVCRLLNIGCEGQLHVLASARLAVQPQSDKIGVAFRLTN